MTDRSRFLLLLLLLPLAGCSGQRPEPPRPEGKPQLGPAETRALAYLQREVPAWSKENRCYSCHNNGDAARALFVARRTTGAVADESLADTLRWLADPDGWQNNGGDREYSDPIRSRLQFSAALSEAVEAGLVSDRAALVRAAELIAEHQRPDGSWKVGPEGRVGEPASHGEALAVALARRTYLRADPRKFKKNVERTDSWLRKKEVVNVLDAGSVLIGLDGATDPDAARQRQTCLDLIRRGQGRDGGWGPFVDSQSEPFDTAVVLLALKPVPEEQEMLRRGRDYLLSAQNPDGSWPETTRPPGVESYAQRLSTTGWATLALLDTVDGGERTSVPGDGANVKKR